MKILLVADFHGYSTFDVYTGLVRAFVDLNIPFDAVNTPQLLEMYSVEVALTLITAKAVIKENAYTHVLFVSGTMIPVWVLDTIKAMNIKIGYVATDDPHSSKMLLENLKYSDYYFTNERTMDNPMQRIFYVPMAASANQVDQDKQIGSKNYENDICFIGSVYPNRVKPIEAVLKYAIKNNKKFALYGPKDFIPSNSILNNYIVSCIVNNEDSIRFYANSKCVINLNRDPKWSPSFKGLNPNYITNVEPFSTNPRAYEVAVCKVPQLFIEPRHESLMMFRDNAFYCGTKQEDIWAKLDEIFGMDKKVMDKKLKKCCSIVVKDHLYTNRAAKILDTLIHY